MPHKNPEQRKEWRKQYREKNKEAIRAKEKEYYHKIHKHKFYIKEEQARFRRTPQSRLLVPEIKLKIGACRFS